MGCDIHCYIEHSPREVPDHMKDQPRYWFGFGGRINPGRSYDFFANIAGVRNYDDRKPMYPERGLPPEIGFMARYDNEMFIVDDSAPEEDHSVHRSRAIGWVESGSSKYTDESKKWVTHPDLHSHSWVTGKEWRECVAKTFTGQDSNWHIEYHAMSAALSEFEKRGCDTRVVFWFDN